MEEIQGVIYILTNPSFPEFVKIGFAEDLKNRLEQLNNSSAVPYAFRAYAKYEVCEKLTDITLHQLIDNLNPNLRTQETVNGKKRIREFYQMSKEDAYRLLECIAKISGTTHRLHLIEPSAEEIKEEKEAEDLKTDLYSHALPFSVYGIPIGAKLQYVSDPSILVEVIDERHVLYNGKITSLSAVAGKLRNSKSIRGTLWFKYNGKTLVELRNQLQKNGK